MLVVQGGINDIAQGYDVELAAENLRAMVRRGKDLGLRVTIANVLPWNAGWPHTEEAINRLNESIDELARDENVPVLPFYATLESPELPGRMRDEWTSDGDHLRSRATGGWESSPSGCHERLRRPLDDRDAPARARAPAAGGRRQSTGRSTAGAPSPTSPRRRPSTRRCGRSSSAPARR